MMRIFISVLSMLYLICIPRCAKDEYPVEVSQTDGIRVVQNPDFPKYSDDGYSFEEILTLGLEEGDDNYLFHRVTGVDVDSNGNIYILDSGNHRIQVFDKNGRFQRTIGRKGRGPGELDRARGIATGRNDKIFIAESRPIKITCFHAGDGRFINDFMLNEGMLLNMYFHNGVLYIETMTMQVQNNKPAMFLEILKLNENGDVIKSITELENPKRLQRSGNYAFSTSYEPEFTWTVGFKGRIYTGKGGKYEISRYDSAGILNMRFGRIFKQARISSNEKNKELEELPQHLRNEVQFPKLKPVFDRIISDDNGNIWVHLFEKDKNGFEQFDVFDDEGVYLRKVALKDNPVLIKNDFAYVLTQSDNGFPIIKKYKIKELF